MMMRRDHRALGLMKLEVVKWKLQAVLDCQSYFRRHRQPWLVRMEGKRLSIRRRSPYKYNDKITKPLRDHFISSREECPRRFPISHSIACIALSLCLKLHLHGDLLLHLLLEEPVVCPCTTRPPSRTLVRMWSDGLQGRRWPPLEHKWLVLF